MHDYSRSGPSPMVQMRPGAAVPGLGLPGPGMSACAGRVTTPGSGYNSTITVCAVPCSSMHRHDGSWWGMESGPLNFSYTPTVRNSFYCPRGRSSWGRKNPNCSPPVSMDVTKAMETSVQDSGLLT